MQKELPPDAKHSDLVVIDLQSEILPVQLSVSLAKTLQRLLS